MLAGAFALGLTPLASYDVWWHLATGDYLLGHWAFPSVDPFSYPLPGTAVVFSAWLFDVAIALAQRVFGLHGLSWVQAGLVAWVFGVIYAQGLVADLKPAFCAAGLLVVAPLLRFHFLLRPHLVSYGLLGLLLLFLRLGKRTGLRRYLVAAGLTLWCWRQIHGSYPFGILVLSLFLALVPAYRSSGSRFVLSMVERLLFASFGALALVLPPLGFSGIQWIVGTLRLTVVTRGVEITEWLSPWRLEGFGWLWIYALVAGVGIALSRRSRNLFSGALFALGGAMAFQSVRHIAFFVILTIIPATVGWLDISSQLARRLPRKKCMGRWIPLLLVLASACFLVVKGLVAGHPPMGTGVVQNVFPSRAADFVESRDLRGNLFNNQRIGGYLIWRLGPTGRKVFWDSRFLVHLPRMIEVWKAEQSPSSSQAVADLIRKFDFSYAIVDYRISDPITKRLLADPKWGLVYWDDNAMVLAQMSRAEPRLHARRYRVVRPWDRGLKFLEEPRPRLLRAREELRRKLLEDPGCSKAAALEGLLLLRLRRFEEAIVCLRRFLVRERESLWVRLVLVQALLVGDRPGEALAALEPLRGHGSPRAEELEREAERSLAAIP